MSSPREKEKKKKACNDLTKQFLSCSNHNLVKITESLFEYIPEFTTIILGKVYTKIINILSTKDIPKIIIDKIVELLLLMLKKSNGNLQEDPYRTIFSNNSFLSCIFMHTGLDEKSEFNHQVINLIYNFLLLKDPEFFVRFFLESKKSIYLLMNSLANQSGDDIEAAQLFNSIFVSNVKIKDSLIKEVIPLIRNYPPHLVVDLMISSEEIKDTMTVDEFREWLLTQSKFTLSDVNQIFDLYPPLWQSLLPFQLILKTDPPRRLAFIKWMHTMPPIQNIELPTELMQEAFKQIICPPYKFESIDDTVSPLKYNSYDLFIFSRLFVLTYSNPAHALTGSIKYLYGCIHSKSELISTASIQVLVSWIVKFNFSVQSNIVYRICEEVSTSTDKSIKSMYQILLHFISKNCKVAEMILRNDPNLRFNKNTSHLIRRSFWEFMNFDDFIDQVPSYDDFDEKGMLRVLDCITEYFGIQVNKNDDLNDDI